ncbi:hypothetical protein G6F59_017143 [Rhizopus arrhizus]|nr:hypothetical protein G6F59_017143 [Rhizopus arrhizus]
MPAPAPHSAPAPSTGPVRRGFPAWRSATGRQCRLRSARAPDRCFQGHAGPSRRPAPPGPARGHRGGQSAHHRAAAGPGHHWRRSATGDRCGSGS